MPAALPTEEVVARAGERVAEVLAPSPAEAAAQRGPIVDLDADALDLLERSLLTVGESARTISTRLARP